MGILTAGILKIRLVMTLWIRVDKAPSKDPGEGSGRSQSVRPESGRQGSEQGFILSRQELEHGAEIRLTGRIQWRARVKLS